MKIFGQDYEFRLTVSASTRIAELCPDKDLTRMGEIMSGTFSQMMNAAAELIVAMAEGYDRYALRNGIKVEHDPLTKEMLFDLTTEEFKAIQLEAMKAFRGDIKPTVEVAPGKKKEKESA